MDFSWWRRQRPTQASRRLPCSNLILEVLEDRTLPSGTTLQLVPAAVRGVSPPTVTFAVDSFQFGAENPTTIGSATGGAGAGKMKFDALDVTAAYHADSPLVFANLASGGHYKTATLTETNANGQPIAIWVLGTVFVTNDTLTKNQAGLPVEELKFVFGSATEANSTQSRSWNQVTNRADGPALPAELFLSPLPAPAATDLTLQLVGVNLPTINLDLHTSQFGARNSTTIGSATAGAGAGKMKFDALDVTADLSNASPGLFKVLASGGHYKTATLTETNADGQPIAIWVLGTVFVINDSITKNQAGLPVEELKFVFGSATEANSTQSKSWNQVTNRANGPALPAELNLIPLPPPAATDLTLQLVGANLPTINLDLHTFQFGARNSTTIGSATGGAGAGKMKFDALDVTADLSNASPDLLKALASGGHYKTATLTETNADGQPIAIWVLGTVFVTNDSITKNQAGLPVEELKFVFGSATEANSTQSRSWNQVTNRANGPALPAELNLIPLPAPAATDLTLQLVGANLPTINLDLHTFQFGARNSTTIGSATAGAGAGKMKFDALDVTADLSNASPDLLKALASGGHYKTATLTETNADGQPIAIWVLGTVFVTNDSITKNQAGLPVEELKFVFGSATEANSTQSRSWNQVTNRANGPALPAELNLSPLPAPAATDLTLQLVGANLPTINLDLHTFQFGARNSTTIGSATAGAGAGKMKFDALDVTADLSNASPDLLKALASGGHYKTATLTETIADGQPIAIWVLGTVFVTNDSITKNQAGLPVEELKFVFGSATEANSTQSRSWNQVTNRANGPALPAELNLSPLPAPAATDLTLQLVGANLPTINLDLHAFQFGARNSTTIGSATGGAGAGKMKFDALDVTADLSNASPDLLKILASGGHYKTATLTETIAGGQPIAVWVLGTVFVTNDTITKDQAGLPVEELKFVFGSATEANSTQSRSWNQVTNRADGPALPAGLVLSPLPGPTGTNPT